MMTRIGVLGSGAVGQTLARGLQRHGYEVRIASRTPERLADFSAAAVVTSGTFGEVAAWAEGVVLTVLGTAAAEVLQLAGPANLQGKLVIDTTNPIAAGPPEDGVLRLFTSPNSSLMETLQELVPGAHFVKAFNSVGATRMVNPSYSSGTPTMFYCGNNAEAKAEAKRVIEQLGWDAADMGTAKAARAIEPLCQLWCIPGFREQSWTHAFSLLRR
jgi:8-hydroxy-5-deazaflavin:NADPH oxidoreductase